MEARIESIVALDKRHRVCVMNYLNTRRLFIKSMDISKVETTTYTAQSAIYDIFVSVY